MNTKRRGRGGRRRAGQTIVEAALVLPIVLMFILGIFEYGRYLMYEHIFNNAVRAGAVYAAKHSSSIVVNNSSGTAVTYGNATTDVQNIVTGDLFGEQLGSQVISVFVSDNLGNNVASWPGGQPGQFVCVQITGTYYFLIPGWLGLPTSISTQFQSVQPCEGN